MNRLAQARKRLDAIRAEERSDLHIDPANATDWRLGNDVAQIARRFGSAYRLTVSRLLGQGVIAEADSTRLLKPKLVELAGEWVTLFSARAPTPHPAYPLWLLSELSATRAHMAVEAYRRGLITKTELLTRDASTLSLQVPGLSETKLLGFAEAAR